jgi:hypothetical protein
MRGFLKLLVTVLLGVALGLSATWLLLARAAPMGGDVRDGPWRTSLAAGSAQGGAWLRASVALHGLFALNRSETIYYTATTDGAGAKLDARCTYRIAGRDPPTRWWSITAYGADDFLIPNPKHLYSVSKNSVRRRAGGSFTVTLKRDAARANEIATGSGAFSVTLRLYNPDAAVAADPAHVTLPRIEKETCA